VFKVLFVLLLMLCAPFDSHPTSSPLPCSDPRLPCYEFSICCPRRQWYSYVSIIRTPTATPGDHLWPLIDCPSCTMSLKHFSSCILFVHDSSTRAAPRSAPTAHAQGNGQSEHTYAYSNTHASIRQPRPDHRRSPPLLRHQSLPSPRLTTPAAQPGHHAPHLTSSNHLLQIGSHAGCRGGRAGGWGPRPGG
jgi:hypothetical protein